METPHAPRTLGQTQLQCWAGTFVIGFNHHGPVTVSALASQLSPTESAT